MPLVDADTIELTTVGIDIGSSTSHAAIARLKLVRMSNGMTSRFVVTSRSVVQESEVMLTPYLSDGLIDVRGIEAMVASTFAAAGMTTGDVDTGAVILTGTALERANSEAVAHLFAEQSGQFVCAAAGHNLEAILAAHGSGAVDLARQLEARVLHVDIGGGTTKFSLIEDGRVLETAAIQVGGRLVAFREGTVARLEPAGATFLEAIGVPGALGEPLDDRVVLDAVGLMAEMVADCIQGKPPTSGPLASLVLTGEFGWELLPPTMVTFSGGVSEFLRQTTTAIPSDDLGRPLMDAVADAVDRRAIPARLHPLREGVRATVVGASQYSVQVSGSTVDLADVAVLPLHGVPVARPAAGDEGLTTRDVIAALARLDLVASDAPIAVSLPFSGVPNYASLRRIADSLVGAMGDSLASEAATVVSFEPDVGLAFGTVLREVFPTARNVVILDGLDLHELDFVDVGDVLGSAGVVPVVVKSLAFPQD